MPLTMEVADTPAEKEPKKKKKLRSPKEVISDTFREQVLQVLAEHKPANSPFTLIADDNGYEYQQFGEYRVYKLKSYEMTCFFCSGAGWCVTNDASTYRTYSTDKRTLYVITGKRSGKSNQPLYLVCKKPNELHIARRGNNRINSKDLLDRAPDVAPWVETMRPNSGEEALRIVRDTRDCVYHWEQVHEEHNSRIRRLADRVNQIDNNLSSMASNVANAAPHMPPMEQLKTLNNPNSYNWLFSGLEHVNATLTVGDTLEDTLRGERWLVLDRADVPWIDGGRRILYKLLLQSRNGSWVNDGAGEMTTLITRQ